MNWKGALDIHELSILNNIYTEESPHTMPLCQVNAKTMPACQMNDQTLLVYQILGETMPLCQENSQSMLPTHHSYEPF